MISGPIVVLWSSLGFLWLCEEMRREVLDVLGWTSQFVVGPYVVFQVPSSCEGPHQFCNPVLCDNALARSLLQRVWCT